MNGQSFTPRLRENMNENMEFPGATGEYIEWLQDSFARVIKEEVERDKNDPFVKREERGKVINLYFKTIRYTINYFRAYRFLVFFSNNMSYPRKTTRIKGFVHIIRRQL